MKLEEQKTSILSADVAMIMRKLDNIKTLLEKQASVRKIAIQDKALLGTEQASAYLNISRTALYRLTAKGEIPFVKIGGRRKYYLNDLDTYLKGEYIPIQPSILK